LTTTSKEQRSHISGNWKKLSRVSWNWLGLSGNSQCIGTTNATRRHTVAHGIVENGLGTVKINLNTSLLDLRLEVLFFYESINRKVGAFFVF